MTGDTPSKASTLFWFAAAVVRALCNASATVIGRYLHEEEGMDALQSLIMFGTGNIFFCAVYGGVSQTQRNSIKEALKAMKPELSLNYLNLCIGSGMRDVCWFLTMLGASLITSADTWTIQKSSALVFTVLLVFLVFNERPTQVILMSVMLCILGTTMVSQPDFLFGDGSLNGAGVMIAVLGGFANSATLISTQYLKGVHSKFALAYSRMLLSAVLYLVIPSVYFMMYPHRWTNVSDNPKACCLWILAGVFYSSSLPISPMANVIIGAQALSIVAQSVIVWSALIEIFILNERENTLQYCGMVTVVLAVMLKPLNDMYQQSTADDSDYEEIKGEESIPSPDNTACTV